MKEEKNKKSKNTKNTKKELKKENKKVKKKKHKKLKAFFMILFIAIFIAIIVVSAIFIANFKVAKDEFNIDDIVIGDSNSTILDSEGNVLATLNGEEKRKIISLSDMADYLPKAYVAIEDERYYLHSGVDFKRTGAAILNYVFHRGSTSFGGSTITQQLVKNATDEKEKTIDRKLKEWARAYKVEEVLSKDQILETYLNIIFVGQGYYGVELGAKYYFNKSAKDLTLAQCAFMAGINNSPAKYKPFDEDPTGENMKKIKDRTKTVLAKMKELNYIKSEEYTNAVAEVDNGLAFSKGETQGNVYSYHTDALIQQLINDVMKEKQISKELATSYVYGGGLTIYSTQNSRIQSILDEEAKSSNYTRKSKLYDGVNAQSATVVMDQKTGYVVGCLGGLGEKTESRGLNRATQTTRQTGSSFKPLSAVLPGLQEKILTASSKEFVDEPTTFPGNYHPKNYNYYRGNITIRQALETSQNIPFIKVVQKLTVKKSKEYLEKMGISTLNEYDSNLSMAIGGLNQGVSPLEMCAAYATIANDGKYNSPKFYSKVEDSKGNVVLEKKPENTKVFDENVDYVGKTLIQEPVKGASGTATYCAIPGIDTAAKTWYGYDKKEEVSGSTNVAGRFWAAAMKKIHQGLEPKTFTQPSGVVSALVCRETGLCASQSCSDVYTEKFVVGTVPGVCNGHVVAPQVPVVEETPVTEPENQNQVSEEEARKQAEQEAEARKQAEQEAEAKRKAEEEAQKPAEVQPTVPQQDNNDDENSNNDQNLVGGTNDKPPAESQNTTPQNQANSGASNNNTTPVVGTSDKTPEETQSQTEVPASTNTVNP